MLETGWKDRITIQCPAIDDTCIFFGKVLKGHVTPICQIIMDSENQLIISVSKDKVSVNLAPLNMLNEPPIYGCKHTHRYTFLQQHLSSS